MILQKLQLFHVGRGDEIGPRRQHLPELDEGRAELLEHETESARSFERSVRSRARIDREISGRDAVLSLGRATNEALVAVLSDDPRDAAEALQVPEHRASCPRSSGPWQILDRRQRAARIQSARRSRERGPPRCRRDTGAIAPCPRSRRPSASSRARSSRSRTTR